MTHHIVLWKWASHNADREYEAHHVNGMVRSLLENIKTTKARIICVTDNNEGITDCETFPLWKDMSDIPNATKRNLPSCYRRLKLYDHETQKDLGMKHGDRILSLDLDALIVGRIDDVLATPGEYIGWELRGPHHPRVFNGSFQMFSAGDLRFIWEEFDPALSPRQALEAQFLGSDQSWLSYRLIEREGSVGLKWPQVSSYPLQNKIQGLLSIQNRIVFFHGKEKPWHPQVAKRSPWVSRYLKG